MEKRAFKSILARHKFFKGLKDSHLQLLASCASTIRGEAGTFLFRASQEAKRFYLIREGKVSIQLHVPGRSAVSIHTVDKDGVLGWSWLIKPYRWHFDARVKEPTLAFDFDAKCIRMKCEKDPALGYEIYKRFATIMTERIEQTNLQLLDIYGVD